MPRVLLSCGRSEVEDSCCCFVMLDVSSNDRVEVVPVVEVVAVENLLKENLERMDCAALRAHRRGFRLRRRDDDVLAFSELFSADTAADEADIDRPLDPLLGIGAAAILVRKSDRFVVDNGDDRFCVVTKAHDDGDDVIRDTGGSLPIRSGGDNREEDRR